MPDKHPLTEDLTIDELTGDVVPIVGDDSIEDLIANGPHGGASHFKVGAAPAVSSGSSSVDYAAIAHRLKTRGKRAGNSHQPPTEHAAAREYAGNAEKHAGRARKRAGLRG